MSAHATHVRRHARQGGLPRVFVTGDLNMDVVATGVGLGGITRVAETFSAVGGSAYNAALAFKQGGFHPVVFGKVGDDAPGRAILSALDELEIDYYIAGDGAKPTCVCNVIYFTGHEELRTIFYQGVNSNDYDVAWLRSALEQADFGGDDLVFSPLHIYEQTGRDVERCAAFFRELRATGCRLIVDIVPHLIYEVMDAALLDAMIGGAVFMLIGERRTFMKLIGPEDDDGSTRAPTEAECGEIARRFESEYYLCRYGTGNISHELVMRRDGEGFEFLGPARETGYEGVPDGERRGFGDRLTASTLGRILRAAGGR